MTPGAAFVLMLGGVFLCVVIRRRLLSLCSPTTPKMYYFAVMRLKEEIRKVRGNMVEIAVKCLVI